MPLLLALGGLLLELVGPMVARALLALGLGFVAYQGFDLAIGFLESYVKNGFNSMPAGVVSFLAWCWVDKAIGLVFSSYSACITYKLAGSTVLKKIAAK